MHNSIGLQPDLLLICNQVGTFFSALHSKFQGGEGEGRGRRIFVSCIFPVPPTLFSCTVFLYCNTDRTHRRWTERAHKDRSEENTHIFSISRYFPFSEYTCQYRRWMFSLYCRLLKIASGSHACYLSNPSVFQSACLNFFDLVRHYSTLWIH